jgi:hypothetical protein
MPDNTISLDVAIQMTTLYRTQKENILAEPFKGQNILPISETFDRSAFDSLLNEADCVGVRIYYGMSDNLEIHAVAIGVNSKNEDILPSSTGDQVLDSPPVIVEDAIRCPDDCPPESPLNP